MKTQNIRNSILAADLLLLPVMLMLAIGLRYPDITGSAALMRHFQGYSFMLCAAFLAWIFLYFELSLDGFRGGWHIPAILSKAVVAVSLLMMVVFAVAFLTQHNYSRLVLFYFAVSYTVGLFGIRIVARSMVISYSVNAEANRCIILGNGPLARELAAKIASHPELPFQVIGFLFPAEAEVLNGFSDLTGAALGNIKTLQLLELIAERKIKKLIIATGQPNGIETRKLIEECRKSSIQVYVMPQLYDLYLSKAELIEIDTVPLLSLEERKPTAISLTLKRTLDVALSCGLLVLFSPVLLVTALLVYMEKGKAFESETRCGSDGVCFRMHRLNIERHSTLRKPYERLFIRWSVTELPQLWNVVRGDMSLVGPRPETPDRVKYYSEWQRQRLKIRAGVTGLAQVHGLRDQHSSEDKTRFDLQYISNWSPLLDLSLILQTVWTLLCRGPNEKVASASVDFLYRNSSEFATREVADVNRS